MLTKIGKALDQRNAEIAALRARNDFLATELEAKRPYSRKRVHIDANDQFATIGEIDKAQKISQQPPKKRSRKTASKPTNLVKEAEEIIVRGLEQYRAIDED